MHPASYNPPPWSPDPNSEAQQRLAELFAGRLRSGEHGLPIMLAGPNGSCDLSACQGPGASLLQKALALLPERWRVTDQQIEATAAARPTRPRSARRAPPPPPPPAPGAPTAPPSAPPPTGEAVVYVRWIPDQNYRRVDGMPNELWLRFGTTPNGEGYPGFWHLTYASTDPPRRDN